MKKTIYRLSVVAAALAAVLLTAQCAKEIDPAAESKSQDSIGDGIEVTLTATKGEDTRAELADATTKVSVTWSAGDKIYVVGETDGLRGYLTLSSGAGSSSATFKGCIKYLTVKQNVRFYYAGKGKEITGDTFDLSIATQYGTLERIEPMHVMCGTLSNVSPSTLNFGTVTMTNMIAIGKFDIINCTGFDYTSSAKLTGAVSSATLDLKTGAWTGQTTSEITLNYYLTENYFVALIPSDSKQTLTFSQEGKTTPDTLAAKVITAGSVYMSKGFDNVLDNSIEIGIYKYEDGDDFWGYGRIIGDGDKVLVWAPVNCGFDETHTYGLLYQFGRKVGSTYKASWSSPSTHDAETQAQDPIDSKTNNPKDDEFYGCRSDANVDWYSGTRFLTWPSNSGDSGYLKGKIDNPCPTGWRVPTYAEIELLYGENSSGGWTTNVDDQNGYYYNNTDKCTSGSLGAKVFLPATGSITVSFCTHYNRGVNGSYRCSTGNNNYSAPDLFFSASESKLNNDRPRARGFAVRCVRLPDTDVSTTLPGMGNSDVTW